MDLKAKREQLIEDLSLFQDPQERLSFLIDQARGRPGLPEDLKVDAFLVEGCQSRLWLVPAFEEGLCVFETDSDAVITKGIAGVLTDFYSGARPQEILQVQPDFLEQVGITQHLTPNRRNGLTNLSKRIESFARSSA